MIQCKLYYFATLSMCLLYTSYINTVESKESTKTEKSCNVCSPCCSNGLSVCALHAGTIDSCCLQTSYISATDICVASSISTPLLLADDVETQKLCANDGGISSLCTNHVQADELCALKAMINELCARQLVVENACITNLRNCSPFSARASLDTVMTYNLGDPLPFDDIISDPSGSMSQSPTKYTAPDTGTYVITVQARVNNLMGANTIAGTPTASLELYVNDIIRRNTAAPFLSFNTAVDLYGTTVLFLNKGDVVTSKFQVFVMDPTTGLIPYVGQVTLLGDPNPANFRPIFYAQYLSTDCTALDCPSICDIQCSDLPCVISCSMSDECMPCIPPCGSSCPLRS
jgi:hypothetical protein